jgi:hypothetical protein
MDFSKLNQNEKLAVYGSAALIVGGVVGYSYGLTALGILAAIAMLVVVFLPQLSSTTKLPGSRGSLMVAVGGLAGAAMALALLSALAGNLLVNTNFRDIAFLVAVVGGLLMAWAGWQEFQGEGGKFQLGASSSSASAAAASAPAATAPSEPAATATSPAAAADEPAPEMAEAAPAAVEPATAVSQPPPAVGQPAPAATEPVDAPTEDPLREDDRPAT